MATWSIDCPFEKVAWPQEVIFELFSAEKFSMSTFEVIQPFLVKTENLKSH